VLLSHREQVGVFLCFNAVRRQSIEWDRQVTTNATPTQVMPQSTSNNDCQSVVSSELDSNDALVPSTELFTMSKPSYSAPTHFLSQIPSFSFADRSRRCHHSRYRHEWAPVMTKGFQLEKDRQSDVDGATRLQACRRVTWLNLNRLTCAMLMSMIDSSHLRASRVQMCKASNMLQVRWLDRQTG
jgi:hypothetical protein